MGRLFSLCAWGEGGFVQQKVKILNVVKILHSWGRQYFSRPIQRKRESEKIHVETVSRGFLCEKNNLSSLFLDKQPYPLDPSPPPPPRNYHSWELASWPMPPASAFWHQGQSGTACHLFIRRCPATFLEKSPNEKSWIFCPWIVICWYDQTAKWIHMNCTG